MTFTIDPRELTEWAAAAQSMFPAQIELVVPEGVIQSVEFRSGDLQPLRIERSAA